VKIDSERVEEIKQIAQPRNKKEVQYFLGKDKISEKVCPQFC
jgi:hypothetical protein